MPPLAMLYAETPYEKLKREAVDVLTMQVHGHNPSVGTTLSDIWYGTDVWPGFLTSNQRIRAAAGNNPADTANGAGLRSVRVYGILEDGTFVEEVIPTAGASTGAFSTNAARFWWRAKGEDVGASNVQTANFALEAESAGTVIVMEQAHAFSQLSMMAIPPGYWGAVHGYTISTIANTAQSMNIWMFVRENYLTTTTPRSIRYSPLEHQLAGDATFVANLPPGFPLLIPPESYLWGGALNSGAGGEVNIDYTLELLKMPASAN